VAVVGDGLAPHAGFARGGDQPPNRRRVAVAVVRCRGRLFVAGVIIALNGAIDGGARLTVGLVGHVAIGHGIIQISIQFLVKANTKPDMENASMKNKR